MISDEQPPDQPPSSGEPEGCGSASETQGEDSPTRSETKPFNVADHLEKSETLRSRGSAHDLRSPSPHPSHIGPYRIITVIGAGGMGSVYRAEQQRPIRRLVAVKLVKLGMDTAEVIARFETERQALAVMNHPNIAHVFDAGSTEQGRPFFVMELVDGETITRYCDRMRLGIGSRLDLFVQVCEGVHHAHQKGVIHRDLKPTNILVATVDGRPTPKIIDFGIAKAMDQRLIDTSPTELGHTVGTPEYMSPEQMGATCHDIDIRTDVYSLGILLSLLLADAHPFHPAKDNPRGSRRLWQRICLDDPALPSAALAREDADTIASLRSCDPKTLARQLHGDLDWIVLKCVEKDRANRYETALDLAADIRRHLAHLPVIAGPPSAAYRLGKFIRRHTLAVIAAGTILAALVLGFTGTTLGLVRALRAEERARSEAETARQALAENQELSRFLIDLFKVADPSQARGETVTARELLDRGANEVRAGFSQQPLARARIMNTIGQTYEGLGLYAEAEPLIREALEIRQQELSKTDLVLAESLTGLGVVRYQQGRFDDAVDLFQQALEITEAALGQDHLDVAKGLLNLGSIYSQQGREDEAEVLLKRGLAIREKALGPDHVELAYSLNNLGDHYRQHGRYQEAEPLLRRALAIKEKTLGPDHPSIAIGLNNLGNVYREQGRLEDAEPLFERSLAIREKVLGPDHPEVARILYSLANIHADRGEWERAEALHRRALTVWEEALGPDHPNVALAVNGLGGLCLEQGRFDEAEVLLRRALTIFETALGPDHPNVAFVLQGIALSYLHRKRFDRAEPLFERALTILESTLPPEHPGLVTTVNSYARLLRDTGRDQEAAELEARLPGRDGR